MAKIYIYKNMENFIIFNSQTNLGELAKNNIFIDKLATVADGVKIGVNVEIAGESVISSGCEIGANSVIRNSCIGERCIIVSSNINTSVVGDNVTIGPWANLRERNEIGSGCKIGNFVEIKASTLGVDTKVAHLTYIGDAIIGKRCNVGCGVVFCNYNGREKYKTFVGDNVFLGSNCNFVSPVVIGDNAFIAAGSTINKNVAADEFAIARARQENKKNTNNIYVENLKDKGKI